MNDLAMLRQRAEAGEVDTLMPLADAAIDAGHKHGDELAQLAVEISTTDDWAIAVTGIAVFFELLKGE